MTSQPDTVFVKHDGMDLRLCIEACRINLAGEFAGNLEIQIGCDPDLLGILVEHLRLEAPGIPRDGVAATQSTHEGVGVCFHCHGLLELDEVPQRFGLFWDDERIAELAPMPIDSVPIAREHPMVDASQIQASPRAAIASRVRLVGPGRPLGWIPALALGAAAGFVYRQQPFGAENADGDLIAALILMALAAAIVAAELLIPRREVWYERDRRRISILQRKRISGSRDLDAAQHRKLEDFAHVRIYEWSYWDSDHEAQTRWPVSLEGPIRYAADDGLVHRRTDALQLRVCTSAWAARQLAAEVAHHTGLRILDTGTRTA